MPVRTLTRLQGPYHLAVALRDIPEGGLLRVYYQQTKREVVIMDRQTLDALLHRA